MKRRDSSYQCLDHSRWWLSCVLAVCFPWPLLRFPCWHCQHHCQHRLRWPPPSPPRPWHRQKPLATKNWRPHATEKLKKNSEGKRNFAAIAVRLQWCAGSQCCVECSTWADLKPFLIELLGVEISGEDKGYWEETNKEKKEKVSSMCLFEKGSTCDVRFLCLYIDMTCPCSHVCKLTCDVRVDLAQRWVIAYDGNGSHAVNGRGLLIG